MNTQQAQNGGTMLARMTKPITIAATLLLLLVAALPALAHNPAPGPFADTWARTDKPVADGAVERTFIWGPDANTHIMQERYDEAPGQMRDVQYYDKARMEDNTWRTTSAPWNVTNGLLVVELMTGKLQVGDNTFVEWEPANVNIAGDPGFAETPTYATYSMLMGNAAHPQGSVITATVDADGNVGSDSSRAPFNVTAGELAPQTGHRTASVFWDFMTASGPVYQNGMITNDMLFLNPYYATGLPVTEAYWANIMVDGTSKWVLTQAFERRVLTYTPDNNAGWQVEAGNVGLHYYQWRYDTGLGGTNDQVFYAELNTAQEVPTPTVTTEPNGDAVFFVDGDGNLGFELIVVDIQNVTAAHIHLGMSGMTGPVVVTLFMGSFSTPDDGTGTLATGVITAADLEGPLAGMSLSDLLHELEDGNGYVNVHTTQNPAGEIRGQIVQIN